MPLLAFQTQAQLIARFQATGALEVLDDCSHVQTKECLSEVPLRIIFGLCNCCFSENLRAQAVPGEGPTHPEGFAPSHT